MNKEDTSQPEKRRILNYLRSVRFRWWVLICVAFTIIAVSIFCSIFVYMCRKKLTRHMDELSSLLSDRIMSEYGHIDPKKNGRQYLNSLPYNDELADGIFIDPEEEYFTLDIEGKRKELEKAGIFKYCKDAEKICDYDIICPEVYQDMSSGKQPDDKIWKWRYSIRYMKMKRAADCFCICADFFILSGESDKGKKLIEKGMDLAGMFPCEDTFSNFRTRVNSF